jgi:hypothetical protein
VLYCPPWVYPLEQVINCLEVKGLKLSDCWAGRERQEAKIYRWQRASICATCCDMATSNH